MDKTPVTPLPPESVLRLARALGLQEFASACGWEIKSNDAAYTCVWALVPSHQFENMKALQTFCTKWNVRTYLGAFDMAERMGGLTRPAFLLRAEI